MSALAVAPAWVLLAAMFGLMLPNPIMGDHPFPQCSIRPFF